MAAGIHYQEVAHSKSPSSTTASAVSSKQRPASSVAIQIEPTEKTPLIRKNATAFAEEPKSPKCPCLVDLRVVLFGLLLVIGLTIASYLLVIDNELPPIRYSVNLINREAWSAFPYVYSASQMLNPSKVSQVLITHTGGEDCYDMDTCISLLRKMESDHRNKNNVIPYSFMVGGDGEIFEGKGWSHLSGFATMPQETSLVFSLIGNFTQYEPPKEQLDAAKALIAEALKHGKLLLNYQLYGMQNLTVSHDDGSALYKDISQWPHFDTILKFL